MIEHTRVAPMAAAALLIAMTTAPGRAQAGRGDAQWEAGVPEALARSRAARVGDLRYALSFAVPQAPGDRIAAHATIAFALTDPAEPLALDFEPDALGGLRRVEVNGTRLDARLVNGHVVLPTSVLLSGGNTVVIEFDAGSAPLNRGDDGLYTVFVPARAREAFPCFDQPDLKARWALSLEVPADWTTVANGAEIARASAGGRTRLTFAETLPLPTYLFAFAAGRFSVEQGERRGRTFRMLHRETDAQKVARNRDALFDLHADALDWLERYTGMAYPFGKFDFLLLPAFQFSGMEHPGAVFYNAPSMMLDESATQQQLLERASTISHETAHMWFGGLVTMRWFSDVWMKEVFASLMAAKIVQPSFPDIDHDLRFLHAHYPAAYAVDRTAGTNAIRQALDNLQDAGTLYGAIVYQKAPIAMRQLETLIGEDALRDGLREYLSAHAFGNASWRDLIGRLDARASEDLADWSRAWIEERGRPVVHVELTVVEGRIDRLSFVQRDPYPMRGLAWTETLQVALGYPDRVQIVPARLSGARSEVAAARGLPAPLFVLPNGAGVGYGEFHLDAQSLAWLSAHLPDIGDALTRGSAWITLWDALLDGEIPASRFLDLSLEALPAERDELNVQRILSWLREAYWTFSSEAERAAGAGRIEDVLGRGLAAATTTSLKGAYFAAFRDVAATPPAVARLTRVWRGNEVIPGLPLAEADLIVLAKELAVRGVPGWPSILQQQIARTDNPDRKAGLQFVAPALSSDPVERDRFFASLAEVGQRRREPWVVDGLRYLHHPLRAGSSVKYIRPSLELLPEIQRTGDIFLPKRWMDATLGGHRSVEAARIVRAFLEGASAPYPERLRRIVLSSADTLLRASGQR